MIGLCRKVKVPDKHGIDTETKWEITCECGTIYPCLWRNNHRPTVKFVDTLGMRKCKNCHQRLIDDGLRSVLTVMNDIPAMNVGMLWDILQGPT
jgi:hypothetical protein